MSMLCLLKLFWVPSIVVESFQLSPPTQLRPTPSQTRKATPLFAAADEAASSNDFALSRASVPANGPEATEGEATAAADDDAPRINVLELLSTCVDAAGRGCEAIRRVQSQREEEARRNEGGKRFEVDYKIDGDPRSALTAADVAAQAAIVDALASQWPLLTIVGEEDIEVREERAPGEGGGLRKDLCYREGTGDFSAGEALLDRITVFVDPLDGTREFVEGRVENVQTLVGIAVDGVAVAGAVGLPFFGHTAARGETTSSATKIVYGLVGTGHLGVLDRPVEDKASSSASKVNENEEEATTPTTRDSLLLVAGDTDDPVLMDAYQAVSYASAAQACGCDRALMGGTGTKLLAIAEGRADIAVMNFKSSRWDTCATEALVKTTWGIVTDLFGDPIVHRSEIVPPETSYLNSMGVIGSGPRARNVHGAVCQAMRRNAGALRKLLVGSGYGLTDEEAGVAEAEEDETESVTQALQKRRAIQTQGL